LAGWLCAWGWAQDTAWQKFPLRVSRVLVEGKVEVDRGEGVRLKPGDSVWLVTRDGQRYEGRVVQVLDRKSIVELTDRTAPIQVGTSGEALVPSERFTSEEAPEPAPVAPKPTADTEHEPWTRLDEEWSSMDPLLAGIRPLRPEERESRQGGRAYTILEPRWSSEAGRSEVFFRMGGEYWAENPWGRGGELHIDGEWNRLDWNLPFVDDEIDNNLRLDRLSYAWGGTRFDPTRQEVGRFLVSGMPELGLIDGYAVSHRLPSGNLVGASIGGQPEPNPDQESGKDLQISAFYRWAYDPMERLTGAIAYQKTWHNGTQDRDVFIGRMDWMPVRGWQMHGNAWLDVYTVDDVGKTAGPELTRLYLTANKDWDGERGLRALYRFDQFPSLLRQEFQLPAPDTVERDHQHRVSLSGWQRLDGGQRLIARAGLWQDEDDMGGDGELGIEYQDLFQSDSRLGLALFDSQGEFTNMAGFRATYAHYTAVGNWDLLYEFARNAETGFPGNADTFYQHRLRGSLGWSPAAHWNLSVSAEEVLLDDSANTLLGVQFDWSF